MQWHTHFHAAVVASLQGERRPRQVRKLDHGEAFGRKTKNLWSRRGRGPRHAMPASLPRSAQGSNQWHWQAPLHRQVVVSRIGCGKPLVSLSRLVTRSAELEERERMKRACVSFPRAFLHGTEVRDSAHCGTVHNHSNGTPSTWHQVHVALLPLRPRLSHIVTQIATSCTCSTRGSQLAKKVMTML